MAGADGSQPRRILLPIDGSQHSRRAFEWYVDNVRKPTDQVILLNAVEDPILPFLSVRAPGALPYTEFQRLMDEKMEQAKELKRQFVQMARASGLEIEFKTTVHGRPGESIVSAAHSLDVSLIVMGSRGLGTVRRTILGSVSDYVLHHAGLPITILPPPEK